MLTWIIPQIRSPYRQAKHLGSFAHLKLFSTRMHSSSMRTARSSSRRGGGSASVHAGIHPRRCGSGEPLRWGPGDPTGCGPGNPPARPLNLPPGCGPGNLQGMLGYPPPWRPARHAGIPPARHTGIPPPCEQNSWHTLLKILPCPKLRLRAAIIVLNCLTDMWNVWYW